MDSLSRLTKVQELRKKIAELFHVEPQLQRLFYRGKQVRWARYGRKLSIRPLSFVPGTLLLKATNQECPPPLTPLLSAFRCWGEGEQRQASTPATAGLYTAKLATFLIIL